ncbi:hypothetical protein Hdeb2414_s0015g00450811 [Helianthus debilis subsp. tardiflorus]
MSRLHFTNYGTVGIEEPMGIRVLSSRSLFRSLSFLLPLCNEDTGPVTPSSDISGCDKQGLNVPKLDRTRTGAKAVKMKI